MHRLVFFVITALIACAPPPSDDDPAPLVLRGVTVIDGTGAAPSPGMDVVIRGERIAGIMPLGGAQHIRGARIVELEGRYLLPGFIDTHAHVTVLRFPADRDGRGKYDPRLSERALRLLLAHGITTVRNPSAPAAEGVVLRDAVARGDIPGPRILTSGEHLNNARMTDDEMRAEVRRQVALGVDMIKVYGGLPPELVKVAIEEAHDHGIPVVGHLQRTTWTEAVALRIDAITHGAPWSREYLPADRQELYRESLIGRLDWLEWVEFEGAAIREMIKTLAESRTPVDPTLIAYHTKFFGDDPRYLEHSDHELFPELMEDWHSGTHTDNWSPSDYRRAKVLWPRVQELVRRYHEAGVLLSTGSDAPVPWVIPGVSLHEEFELLTAAGISEMDVLTMATRNGAEALGLLDDVGTIEVGKRADLVLLWADPLEDIRHTRQIEFVVQGGRLIRPSELLMTRPDTAASEWQRAERLPWEETDHGIGVVAFRSPRPGDARNDTLEIVSNPDTMAGVEAVLILDEREPGLPSLQFMTEPGMRWNGAEYAYEEAGLPFDSIAGAWARVIYGKSSEGGWERGWVYLDGGAVQALTWPDVLQDVAVFHPDSSGGRFFLGPGYDEPVAFSVPEDFQMIPVEMEGQWMRVRITAPSPCADSDEPVREREAWLRFLDETGRPLVFPKTRGC